ncbi:hypothetical protein [Siphovirus Jomon_CT89]|nr:hypothetical protein [Siphovirus Jomon_CT89]
MSREKGRAYNETPIQKGTTMSCPSLAQQYVLTHLAEMGVGLAVATFAYYATRDYCDQHHLPASNEDMLAMAKNISDTFKTN